MKTTDKTETTTTITGITFRNLNDAKVLNVYATTGFNYGVHEQVNRDGSISVTFDCSVDAEKFMMLYNQ